MEYLLIDPRMDEHPDIEAAGFAATTVFQAVLRAVARNDGKGRLRGKFASPEWLARRMNLRREDVGCAPENWIRHGLDMCHLAGLLQKDGEDYVIPGWDKFYQPRKTNAERQAEWRKRAKSDASVTPVTTRANSNATQPHLTSPHSTEADGGAPAPPTPPAHELLRNVWNELRVGDLPEWRETGKARMRRARDALKRRPLGEWIQVMAKLRESAFCCGKTGWKADPDWWLRPEGREPEPATKLLEGKYDDPPSEIQRSMRTMYGY